MKNITDLNKITSPHLFSPRKKNTVHNYYSGSCTNLVKDNNITNFNLRIELHLVDSCCRKITDYSADERSHDGCAAQ